MTEMNPRPEQTTTGGGSASEPRPARRARVERISDAVVAAYINDISERAGRPRRVTGTVE